VVSSGETIVCLSSGGTIVCLSGTEVVSSRGMIISVFRRDERMSSPNRGPLVCLRVHCMRNFSVAIIHVGRPKN
jgi:hypothetical protein